MQKKLMRQYIKIISVNLISVFLIVLSFVLLTKLDALARDAANVHGQLLANEQSSEGAVIQSDLDESKDKINFINSLFLDDSSLISFKEDLNALKSGGSISDATFVSTTPTTDFLKSQGLPLLIKIDGNSEQINKGVSEVFGKKVLLRPVSLKLNKQGDTYHLEYGIFIYLK